MTSIHLTTFIAAPVDRVFDLSRHLAVFKYLFLNRKERFSSGAASSLLGKGETLSIIVRHMGKDRSGMLKVTSIQKPQAFTEEMVKGDLQHFRHEHHFKPVENGTIVIDLLEFGPPRDMLGRLFGRFYLKRYLENLVYRRNEAVRAYAESEKWRAVLS